MHFFNALKTIEEFVSLSGAGSMVERMYSSFLVERHSSGSSHSAYSWLSRRPCLYHTLQYNAELPQ